MAKMTVEGCRTLDVLDFARQGGLTYGSMGHVSWWQGERETGHLGWLVASELLYFFYVETTSDGSRVPYLYRVYLDHTQTSFGGERPWFCCPGCGGRVRKLYRPPETGRFLCRGCHGLSYASQQRQSPWEKTRAREKKLVERLQNPKLSTGHWVEIWEERRRLLALTGAKYEEHLHPQHSWDREEGPEPETAPVKRPRGRPKTKGHYTRRKPLVVSERASESQGFCVKCRDWRDLAGPQRVTLANGRSALQGTCSVCHTKMTMLTKAI